MNRDAGDIADRYSIAILKAERIGEPDSIKEKELLDKGFSELGNKNYEKDFLNILLGLNKAIWDLESKLRKGALDNNPYEAGLRAIQIRKINSIRIGVKNLLNKIRGEGSRDIKKDHLSE